MRLFDLPGPARFVGRVVQAASERGIAVVQRPARVAGGLADELADRFASTHRIFRLTAEGDESPATIVSEAVDIDIRSGRDLVEADDLRYGALVVDLSELERVELWDAFLRAACGVLGARRDASLIRIVVVASPEAFGGLSTAGAAVLPWRDVVTLHDARLHAYATLPPDAFAEPLLEQLALEVAVSLAGWDLAAIDVLLDHFRSGGPAALLRHPLAPLASGAEAAPSWAGGSADIILRRSFASPFSADPTELDRRLWRAHAAVVFPWLEEMRLEFLALAAARLPARAEQFGATVARDDFEWGLIAYLSKAFTDERLRRFAWLAREARNEIAHRRPVPGDLLLGLITESATISR